MEDSIAIILLYAAFIFQTINLKGEKKRADNAEYALKIALEFCEKNSKEIEE